MPRQINEELTRKEMIDASTSSAHRRQLEKAGWYLSPQIKHINSNNKVRSRRQLQSASGEKLRPFFGRTLMPSMLDKAFKGELDYPVVARSVRRDEAVSGLRGGYLAITRNDTVAKSNGVFWYQ